MNTPDTSLGGTRTRHPVVFLDRDGVVNRMRADYVKTWNEFEPLPGAIDAIVQMSRSDRTVIILTNQSAIAQGLVSSRTVDDIHRRLAEVVAKQGGYIGGFLVCPHLRDAGCAVRKPAPGLLFRARDELGADLESAVMIGDQVWDVEAAR